MAAWFASLATLLADAFGGPGTSSRVPAWSTTAPRPQIPGARYSVAFAINVAIAKYADHLPLERQVKMAARHGLDIDSQTLWDQINALAKVLGPTYTALCAYVLSRHRR